MIRVIATLSLKPDCRARFLEILAANVPLVLAEPGCLEYQPMIDIPSGLPPQISLRADAVILVEAWKSLAALRLHLSGLPHMLAYKQATREFVESVSLQVLAPS